MCKMPGVDTCDYLSPEEWIGIGERVLQSLPLDMRRKSIGCYFYCNIRDETYVVEKDHNTAAARYDMQHILPPEGWQIFGVIIQEHHL